VEGTCGVLSSHIEETELRLESGDDHLIHLDIFPIKLDAGDAIRHIGLEPNRIRSEVEELDVAIVIPRHDAPLFIAEGIS
jgi:hypothetical protein